MRKGLCWVVMGLAGMASLTARADEVADLKSAMEAQEKETASLRQKVDQLEARQKLKEKATSDKIVEVEKKASEKKEPILPDSLKWAQNINFSGDFRYRHEWISEENKANRDRDRIRMRLNLAAKVNEEWDVGMRLATGEKGDPVSTNQTLGQSFSRKPVWLDNAFLGFHPGWAKGLNVTAGKFDQPFYAVGRNQMIWDHDLSPEGGAVRYVWSLSKQTKVTVNGGGFWLAENAAALDPALWGLQGYVEQTLAKSTSILAGVGYYNYANLKGYGNLKKEWDPTSNSFFGNSSVGGSSGVFANDYDEVEVFAELSSKVAALPVSVFGSWVTNTVAQSGSEDTGWLVGFKVNKASDPKSWEFIYDYRDIGKDALVGQFNDSDFIGGGTGGKGHRFNVVYQLAKNVQASLNYYASTITRSATDVDYNRFQADVVVKFK